MFGLEEVTRDAHIVEPFDPAVGRSPPAVIALHKVGIQSAQGLQAFLLAICLFGQKLETFSADGTALLPSILNVDFDPSCVGRGQSPAVQIELTVFVEKDAMVNEDIVKLTVFTGLAVGLYPQTELDEHRIESDFQPFDLSRPCSLFTRSFLGI